MACLARADPVRPPPQDGPLPALPWRTLRRMTYRAPETNDSAPLAQQIEQMIDELPGEQVSVGTLLSALGDEGLLLIVILLSAIFIIPVSIPGLSTVVEAGAPRDRHRQAEGQPGPSAEVGAPHGAVVAADAAGGDGALEEDDAPEQPDAGVRDPAADGAGRADSVQQHAAGAGADVVCDRLHPA
ncbi:hypothetical protein G6F57_017368 [Rhizopus arrhizus]|nr:hypothetical protein G6F57_017368 [Rhizopus arrhizus]